MTKENEIELFSLRKNKEFNLSEKIEESNGLYYGNAIREKDVKEFIKIIEFDLLKKYKMASIPIMEIIKKRAGKKLTK